MCVQMLGRRKNPHPLLNSNLGLLAAAMGSSQCEMSWPAFSIPPKVKPEVKAHVQGVYLKTESKERSERQGKNGMGEGRKASKRMHR